MSTRLVSVSSTRPAQPDDAGQEPARRAVGRQPDAGVGHHELGRPRRHDQVGGQHEAEPGARRAALHRGDDRRVQPDQLLDGRVQVGGDLGQQVGQRGRVLPGRTAPTSPPPQNRAPAPVSSTARTAPSAATSRPPRRSRAIGQLEVDGVGRVGPVELEPGDARRRRRGGRGRTSVTSGVVGAVLGGWLPRARMRPWRSSLATAWMPTCGGQRPRPPR